MVVVDAPGPAEFIEMAIPLLKEKCELLVVTVNTPANAAYNALKKFKPEKCDREEDAEAIYKKFNPDVLAVGTSSLLLGPYVENKFVELAHADNKKIIAFQDFWANNRWPMNYKMMPYWQKILTPDEIAKKLLLEDGYAGEIVITGNPNFDQFIDIDVVKERKWLRQKFGVSENDFIILYVGRGTPQAFKYDEITFEFFAKAIGGDKVVTWRPGRQVRVAIRPHPRDENPRRYEKFSEGLNLLDTSEFPSSSHLLPLFDAVLGMQSANHVEACYLRIPPICMVLPNAGKIVLEKISLADFPPNLVGASIGIYGEDPAELTDVLEKLMSDKNFAADIKSAQEKYFTLPKKSSAKKVAEEILRG